MITFPGKHVRLEVERNDSSDVITESLEHLLRVCRLNNFRGAIVVSDCEEHICYAGLREAVRYFGKMASMRLALVFPRVKTGLPDDLKHNAEATGLDCEVFVDEAVAVRWLGG